MAPEYRVRLMGVGLGEGLGDTLAQALLRGHTPAEVRARGASTAA